MVQVLRFVDEKCTKSAETLLDIIHEKDQAKISMKMSHKKKMEAKADEIDETELKLEEIKREKDLLVYMNKQRELQQTWFGRVVESLEEKTFEIRMTRPMLFNSLFFIALAHAVGV